MEKPSQELKAFGKTAELQPGETQRVTLQLNLRDLASFDEDLNAWVADKGTYTARFCSALNAVEAATAFSLAAPYLEPVSPAK
jgi:beta-glucosidase